MLYVNSLLNDKKVAFSIKWDHEKTVAISYLKKIYSKRDK